VIGAGMVGVCAASWLQRDGHNVFIVETGEPGRGASFGNAGCFNGSSVTPVAMPGVLRNVPGWLLDPLGPLSLRWSYLPTIVPWLIRFIRASSPEKVRAQARALRPLVGPSLETLQPLVAAAGAEDLVHRLGHLYVYRSAESLAKDRLAWELRRENGVEVDEFDANELRQLEPALSRDYVRGLLVSENGHTSNPLALVERLLGHVLRSGGELVRAWAHGFRLEGGRLAAIRTGSGDLPADAAVVCGGAHSKPDCRLRRQVRGDADGNGFALCRHGGAGRACRTPRVAARANSAQAGTQDAAWPAGKSPGGTHLRVDGASAEPARFAAGARPLARHPRCNLCVRARSRRDDRSAYDRQSCRRPCFGAPALDRYLSVRARPFWLRARQD
jgi:FAD dependent oxidoreductase